MRKNTLWIILIVATLFIVALAAQAQEHNADMHMQNPSGTSMSMDTRTLVHFPERMRIHTLKSMRDHLLSISEIQAALAAGEYEKAGDIAEQRLGMTSLKLHGAAESSKYMPKGMQEAGTNMHHAASRFAIAANDAAVKGDLRDALSALTEVTQACVACHTSYRLQ
jgi:hypothetical protein